MIWPSDNQGIILLILSHEGGFVNNPNDKGGPTNMGVTIDQLASFRKATVTIDDIKNLTVAEASALYLQKFIIGPNFDQLTDIKLRTAIVDFAVLFGPIRPIQCLQTLLKAAPDGILGTDTLARANILPSSRPIINQLSANRVSLHADRVTKHPDQLVFLKGWLARALTFIE